jgi:hypothetical protein
LTQIAKSKRVLFVEGKDFLVFSKFARILKKEQVANRSDFAVVAVEGFNPTRLHAFKDGIEKTIGTKIISAVIFDKDNCFAHIHSRKEIENFLLVPIAIENAIKSRINEINKRTGKTLVFKENINTLLNDLSSVYKNRTQAQLQSHRFKYEKSINPKLDESTIIEKILNDFDKIWRNFDQRMSIISGKEFLSTINDYLQKNYKITITQSNIINELKISLVQDEMKQLIDKIELFRTEKIKE